MAYHKHAKPISQRGEWLTMPWLRDHTHTRDAAAYVRGPTINEFVAAVEDARQARIVGALHRAQARRTARLAECTCGWSIDDDTGHEVWCAAQFMLLRRQAP
jgi:hypothetical protein